MAELDPNAGGGGSSGGRGIEQRVDALETRVERIESVLQRLEVAFARFEGTLAQMPKMGDFTSLRSDISEMKGRVSVLPTTWQPLITVIGTSASGAAIVFTLLRFATR